MYDMHPPGCLAVDKMIWLYHLMKYMAVQQERPHDDFVIFRRI
ncbi:MAG: hypothetical protein RIR97_371 [Pseudomonadota bacterium]